MKSTPLPDEILIARVARGERRSLAILYDRHAAAVLGFLVQLVGERPAAEELLQETFWQVWQTAPTYSLPPGSSTNWLFGIAREVALAQVRARFRTGEERRRREME